MLRIESQLHGYRHGHELLAWSTSLSKTDQLVIDRLSDVAGPLRAGEQFDAYLTIYPLPAGAWTVVARTWPDHTVKRPGCVRTLSLLVPSDDWASADSIVPFLELLEFKYLPNETVSTVIPVPQSRPLPPAQEFGATELLEALFLEGQPTAAVFDAPEPELIATRLLTALWPAMRRQFAVSTFALSPRRIEGRDFNLVFAPKSARQKFSDWPGRRIDGRARTTSRHRWSDTIVFRVFEAPEPRLLDDRDLIPGDDLDSSGASLRVSMLWNELMGSVHELPSAALGLLDIASTRPGLSTPGRLALKRAISHASQIAATRMPVTDAWALLSALARKVQATDLVEEREPIGVAARTLAQRDAGGAVDYLALNSASNALTLLLPPMADGISNRIDSEAIDALTRLPAATFAELLLASPKLAKEVSQSASLLEKLPRTFEALSPEQADALLTRILSLLIGDHQLVAARPIILTLDEAQLAGFAEALSATNDFAAESFAAPMAARARQIGAISPLRAVLLQIADEGRRVRLIRSTLEPSTDDARWLLAQQGLPASSISHLLADLLRSADELQFKELLRLPSVAEQALLRLPDSELDLLRRAVQEVKLPLDLHISLTMRLLPRCAEADRAEIAFKALDRGLRDTFSGDQVGVLAALLNAVASVFNPSWVIQHGMTGGLDRTVVGRNLVAFDTSRQARSGIVHAIEEIARAFEDRWVVDLDQTGADACASLLRSAEEWNVPGLLPASARFLRVLFRSRSWPVSVIVPATFPHVYRQLAERDDVPEIFRFVVFLTWDKCKPARRELVDAFLSARAWNPLHFAQTACRCPDPERIVSKAARAYRGREYMDQIEQIMGALPDQCRSVIQRTLHEARTSRWT